MTVRSAAFCICLCQRLADLDSSPSGEELSTIIVGGPRSHLLTDTLQSLSLPFVGYVRHVHVIVASDMHASVLFNAREVQRRARGELPEKAGSHAARAQPPWTT